MITRKSISMIMKSKQQLDRGMGLLMRIRALPSMYGIGTLGKESYDFVDFLKRVGFRYWQVLPVGPTSFGDSPYQSFSAFAGNPYFIDLDELVKEGLLKKSEIDKLLFQSEKSRLTQAQAHNRHGEF